MLDGDQKGGLQDYNRFTWWRSVAARRYRKITKSSVTTWMDDRRAILFLQVAHPPTICGGSEITLSR
ncbi:hypothetical protein J6590_030456 [Homalodisca vitripennis]|nr:hypothetical protein J6590_030456 [Homalodisca vitripennis]